MVGDFRSLARVAAIALLGGIGLTGGANARTPHDGTQDLAVALHRLARRTNIELIFDSAQLAGIRVAASPTTALARLLDRTRFTYRQTDPHTFVIVSRSLKPAEKPQQPPPSSGPEIVVSGSLSQNIDLVRGRDEIQPYWIATADDIDAAGAISTDDFLRTRLPVNRDVAPLSQSGASPRSEVNLRGLGPTQTLVLIDGRRMADVPLDPGLFGQSDINAIPPEAIARIEVLSSAAGGIFGIGATGGAVNIVLKHDYDGLMLSAQNGVTDRGDGATHRIYSRFGWKSPGGRTKVMVSLSYSHDDGVLAGDRPFAEAARQFRVGIDDYDERYASSSVNIRSLGATLTLLPAYGGTQLGSSETYLPLTTAGLNAAGIAALVANAGKQDITLAPDGQGDEASLAAATSRFSAMATIRQDIGDSGELFLDALRMDDRGTAQGGIAATEGDVEIGAGVAGNPFKQAIEVIFPTGLPPGRDPERDVSQRFTAGFIRHYGGGWSSEADIAYSSAAIADSDVAGYIFQAPSVFAGVAALDASLSPVVDVATDQSTNHLLDANVRVVGPLGALPGGPATLTATAEFRREWSAGFTSGGTYTSQTTSIVVPSAAGIPSAEDVWSAFGEAHLPILPARGPARPWRGLTAQLALRLDRYGIVVPTDGVYDPIDNRATVLATTAGLQSRPVDGLMLRASVSTAAMPPTPAQLQAHSGPINILAYDDPLRGGTQYTGSLFEARENNASLRPQRTVTWSAGLVAEPVPLPGLRLSIDYSLLATSHQIVAYGLNDLQFFIDNAALLPGRVTRAPLTAADIAAGYTGGVITAIDVGAGQTGRSRLQTLDFALGEDLPAGDGRLHLSADADWVLSDRRFDDATTGTYELAGYADGPLAWRVNLGVGWSDARWSIGTQAQLYAGYSLADGAPLSYITQIEAEIFGGLTPAQIAAAGASEPRVPMQDYIDLSLAFRPQGPRGMAIRLTVANVFNKLPPAVANAVPYPGSFYIDTTPASSVANYGDVLGRRFAINLQVPFGR